MQRATQLNPRTRRVISAARRADQPECNLHFRPPNHFWPASQPASAQPLATIAGHCAFDVSVSAQLSQNSRRKNARKSSQLLVLSTCYVAKSPLPVQYCVFSSVPDDARHYTGRNPLSEGIFLATAENATGKLHPVVCCICRPVALPPPLNPKTQAPSPKSQALSGDKSPQSKTAVGPVCRMGLSGVR